MALADIYDFTWSDFCDLYIEMAKPRLYDESHIGYQSAVATLNYVLENILKLLHPYMPYITEEIYGSLKENEALIIADYPEAQYNFEQEAKFEQELIEIIRQIRNLRAVSGITNSKKINVVINSENYNNYLEKSCAMLCKMCGIESIEFKETKGIAGTAIHTQNIDVVVDTSNAIDKTEELKKLQAEKEKATAELKRAQGMLANEKFVSKAPQNLIEQEKEKVKKYTEIISKIEESINNL